MTNHNDIRQSVATAYARAISDATGSSCCSGGGGGGGSCATATLAGYEPQWLSALPHSAVNASFGCGDPLAFAEVQPGDTVVDLGCGAGLDLLLAARRVGPTGRVIGIDMTAEMLEGARASIAEAGLDNAEVRQGLIEELPVDDASVDWVISNCVINLSPEKDRVFAEIARVLKHGGRMLVSDMVVDNLPPELRDNEALYHGCIGGAISEADYAEGLRRAGLNDVEVRKRYTYDSEQLAYLLGEGLHGDDGGSCCGVGPHGTASATDVAAQLAGNLHSVQFYARSSP